jgi:hypothetical protein
MFTSNSGRETGERQCSMDPAWIVLVIGDRRGALPTIMAETDTATLIDGGENFRAADTDAGLSAGSLTELVEGTTFRGRFGDADVGPLVELVRSASGKTIRPAAVCATEQLLVVTRGRATIGSTTYVEGVMRVQRADEPMPAVVAGPDSRELIIVIADRRHEPIEAKVLGHQRHRPRHVSRDQGPEPVDREFLVLLDAHLHRSSTGLL